MEHLRSVTAALRGDKRLVWSPRINEFEDGANVWLWTSTQEAASSLFRELAPDAFDAGLGVTALEGVSSVSEVARYYVKLEVCR